MIQISRFFGLIQFDLDGIQKPHTCERIFKLDNNSQGEIPGGKMIIKKNNSIRRENSPNCIAHEYPMEQKDINIAYAEIDGRYPDTGMATNKLVKELVFIVGGEGNLTIDGISHALEQGDALLIKPEQKYFYDGKLNLVISCHPAWTPEQHEIIDT